MKNLLLGLVLLCSCTNNGKQANPVLEKKSNLSTRTENDTLCFPETYFKSEYLDLLRSCYVKYNDSMSNQIAMEYGGGRLSPKYNFDNSSAQLEYSKKNDTIEVKTIWMVKDRNSVMEPDTIYLKGDTVYLRERWRKVASDKSIQGFKFDEFRYLFRLKDKRKKLFFKSTLYPDQ